MLSDWEDASAGSSGRLTTDPPASGTQRGRRSQLKKIHSFQGIDIKEVCRMHVTSMTGDG